MNTQITTDAVLEGFIAWLQSFACVKASENSGWLAGIACAATPTRTTCSRGCRHERP